MFSYPGSLCLPKGFPLSSTLYLGTAKQTSARIESYRVPMYNFLAPTALHTATAVCPLKSVPAVSVKVHLHHRISHMTCGADEILGKAAKPKLQCSPLLIFFFFFLSSNKRPAIDEKTRRRPCSDHSATNPMLPDDTSMPGPECTFLQQPCLKPSSRGPHLRGYHDAMMT